MKQPGLLLIAALTVAGVFTEEQATALTRHYKVRPDYDNPTPIDLPTALDQVCVIFEMADDDAIVREMIANGEICEECGEPIEDHRMPTRARAAAPALPAPTDDGPMSDQDVEAALNLWFGMKGLMRSELESRS